MMAILAKLSRLCVRHAWKTVFAALLLAALSLWLVTHKLEMNTSTSALFNQNMPFLKQDAAYNKAFPDEQDAVLVVIDANSIAKATRAADLLAHELQKSPRLFLAISQPSGGAFFLRNGLLYLSESELADVSTQMAQAQPLLGALTADPSLRGLFNLTDIIVTGVKNGDANISRAVPMLTGTAGSIQAAASLLTAAHTQHSIADPFLKPVDWASLFASAAPSGNAPRAILLTRVKLDNNDLQPGRVPVATIRRAAKQLNLTADNGYHVRLSGDVPLTDEEFATVEHGTSRSGIISIVLVIALVFMALGSWRLVLITIFTLCLGFIMAGGWAAVAVGELNLISIAFAVMFVGLAVDFGIQFCMRLREERFRTGTAEKALQSAITITAMPLLLAGVATAVGFFSFLPTHYKGVADLGLIAGGGIFIAYLLTVTLLPALAKIIKPDSEFKPAGYQFTQPFNHWLLAKRSWVLGATLLITLAAALALPLLRFDFDPLKLKDPKTESMQTLKDMMNDPWATPYTVNVLRPTAAAAEAEAARLAKLPTVRETLTLNNFVPENQEGKHAILDDLALTMGPALAMPKSTGTATGADMRLAAKLTITHLNEALKVKSPAAPLRVALASMRAALEALVAVPDDASIEVISHALMVGFSSEHKALTDALNPEHITTQILPADLKRSWITADGRHRVQIYPKTMSGDAREMAAFVESVRAVAPDAIGPPVVIAQTGQLVTHAFIIASTLALVAILVLLLVMLKDIGDVLRTMAPLLLAGIWTLGLSAAIGFPITFANIIGLPLLLGIGVTYPIYHVIAWRAGEGDLLPSPMARGVFYSALTVMAAFGSLALSQHPGTAGMGKLLAMALTFALIATFVVLPALLGPAPEKEKQRHGTT